MKEVEVEKKVPVASEMAFFFQLNKTELDDESKINLRFLAKSMKQNPDLHYIVEGYADSATGTAQANQSLSDRRAKAVYDEFVALGVNGSQLEVKGMGGKENMFGKNNLNRVSIVRTKE